MKTKLKYIIPAVVAITAVIIAFFCIKFTPAEMEDVPTMLAAAQAYLIENRFEEAIAEFDKALEADPMNVNAYLGLAEAYEKSGDWEKAVETLEKGLEVTGDERIRTALEVLLNGDVEVAEVTTVSEVTTVETTAEITITETITEITTEAITTETTTKAKNGKRVVLDVKNEQMLPEFPNTSEITSAMIVLNYLGLGINELEDKETLIGYLPQSWRKDELGVWDSPWEFYVGNPGTANSYGCYAPVIVEAIYDLSDQNGFDFYAIDLSGSKLEDLYFQIDNGYPIIVWATTNLVPIEKGDTWEIHNEGTFTWTKNSQAMVIVGYDTGKGTVIVADPAKNENATEYDAELFKTRYEEMYSQAIIIK